LVGKNNNHQNLIKKKKIYYILFLKKKKLKNQLLNKIWFIELFEDLIQLKAKIFFFSSKSKIERTEPKPIHQTSNSF